MRKVVRPVRVSEEARQLHSRSLVIDLHTDSLQAARILGLDLSKRHRPPRGMTPWQLHADVPRLREGGVDALFFGIVTHPWPHRAYERACANIDFARHVIEKNGADMAFAGSADDIESARDSGRIAALLGVEGLHMLSGELERIERFHRCGVRYMTMAHFSSNAFAVSSANKRGRSAWLGQNGIAAVELMNSIGMMVDVSHTHSDLIAEICLLSEHPVIVSHGAASALRPVFRNLTDEDIKRVAGTGGVIGLIYASYWLVDGLRPRDELLGTNAPHLEVVVDHADHIRKLVGVDHLALGSDWDGAIMTPDGMRDASDLPALTQLFLDRGYSHEDVEKILGQNFMRVFRAVCG